MPPKRTDPYLRLWTLVAGLDRPKNGCWIWMGAKTWNGHPNFDGKSATKMLWESRFGPMPKGKQACHSCDNPPCMRLKHIFAGTQKQNMEDCVAKGRISRGDRHYRRVNSHLGARGEKVGGALLNPFKVRQVVAFKTKLGLTDADIAILIGVSRKTVNTLLLGKTWRHVTGF